MAIAAMPVCSVYAAENAAVTFEALHVLPPVGKDVPRSEKMDRSLLKHLTVAICQSDDGSGLTPDDFISVGRTMARHIQARPRPGEVRRPKPRELLDAVNEEHCSNLSVAAFDRKALGLGYLTLQKNRYHVQWKSSANDVGKALSIQFAVGGFPVAMIPYTPTAPRTVPIKFQFDNHPLPRTLALRAEGHTASEVASSVVMEFGLSSTEVASFLLYDEDLFATDQIGEAFRDVLGIDADEAITLLLEHYDGVRIAEILTRTYGLSDPMEVGQRLLNGGLTASALYEVLRSFFELTADQIADILRALGIVSQELTGQDALILAERFAPVLSLQRDLPNDCDLVISAWDGEGECSYPMSAELYYDSIIDSGISQKTAAELESLGYRDPYAFPLFHNASFPSPDVPTYFRVFKSLTSGQVRIIYWRFYGWQNRCLPTFDPHGDIATGAHHGDWEHVVVITSQAQTEVAAVKFAVHGSWYTRIRGQTRYSNPFSLLDGEHVIVYPGALQHGSYHDANFPDLLNLCRQLSGDLRAPFSREFSVNTSSGLVPLAPEPGGAFQEAWMEPDRAGGFRWGWEVNDQDNNKNISGVGTHPTQDGDSANKHASFGTPACRQGGDLALDSEACLAIELLDDSMVWKSQCQAGDRDFFGCWHCKSGYTDVGAFCYKWPWYTHRIGYYWYNFWIPWTDLGLTRGNPGRVGTAF